jgi:YD repeat-containing protein
MFTRYGLIASFVVLACYMSHAQGPTITSVSPNPGGIGQSVLISGTNFGSSGTVKFQGNLTASTTNWTSTAITATVPVGAVTGNIVVTTGGHTSSGFSWTLNNGPVNYVYDDLGRLAAVIDVNGNAAEYTYDIVGNILSIARFTSTQISIIDFSPETGPVGTAVTINGTGFSTTPAQNTVKFNGVAATVSSATNTQLQVTVPTAATSGAVSVTNTNGTATSIKNFTVTSSNGVPTITSFSPTSGVAGTVVSLVGTNFDPTLANDKLRLNASQAVVSSVTPTTMATTVPAATASGHFMLVAPAGNAVSSQDFYVPFLSHAPGDIGFTARITPGATQPVTLGTSQIAMVLFDGLEGQHADIEWSGSTFSSSCNLYLIAPDNSTTATTLCTPAYTALGSTYLPKSGTYTIGIDPGTTSGGLTLSLNLDFTGMLTVPAPGATGQAVPVPTTGNLVAEQNARLTFTAIAGQKLSFNVANSTIGSCLLTLYDPDYNSVTSGSCGTGASYVDTVTLTLSGTYTVYLSPQGTATGSVSISINNDQDVTTPTISIGGGEVSAATTAPGQDVRLSFSATAAQHVAVVATNVTNPGAILNVVLPSGTVLASTSINNSPSGQTFLLDAQLPGAGTYQLWVQHSGTNMGSETLQLVPDFIGTLTVPAAGTMGTTVGVPTSGNLAVGQNASLTFSGTINQQLSFNLSSTIGANAGSCVGTLYDPTGAIVFTGEYGWCGSGATYIDTVTLGLTGYYDLYLDPQSTATGNVSVSINNDQDVTTPTISIGGSQVTTTTTVAGQDVRLSFTPTTSQPRIAVLAGNVTNPYAVLNLVTPAGSTVALEDEPITNSPSGLTFFLDTLAVNSGQVYQLWVEHSGTDIGKESLKIYSVPADISHPVTVGGAAYGFSTAVGQNANITFSISTSESVYIHWASGTYPSTLGCTMTVTGPSPSTSVVGSGNCATATGEVSLTGLAAGTYNILVNPLAQSTGGMSLTANTTP